MQFELARKSTQTLALHVSSSAKKRQDYAKLDVLDRDDPERDMELEEGQIQNIDSPLIVEADKDNF